MSLDLVGGVLLVLGALFCLVAAIGVHKLPDALTRMHATSKATTLGLLLVVAGTAVVLHPLAGVASLVLVGLFQLVTAPVAAHLVGRATYRDVGTTPRIDSVDQLADDEP
jgi:multicomponent Na+:H+ antiporter subunit G